MSSAIEFFGFKPSVLNFLHELSENNNRPWFNKNKARYEEYVLTPALNYIAAMAEPLSKIAPNFTAIPKRTGGSLMRIYRDTRFSKDKTPYKTNLGIHFRYHLAKDVHAPGYYLHIAPQEIFVGIGTWHPPSDALLKIREHIFEYPEIWQTTINDKMFHNEFEIVGEKLKTAPRGFPKDHKLIDDLRRKDFIAVRNLDETEIQNTNFVERSAELFEAATPYMKFLCDALGINL